MEDARTRTTFRPGDEDGPSVGEDRGDRPPGGEGHDRRMEPGDVARENQWSSAAARRYRAAEPRRRAKDVPLYTL
jgi:hypothetical protein